MPLGGRVFEALRTGSRHLVGRSGWTAIRGTERASPPRSLSTARQSEQCRRLSDLDPDLREAGVHVAWVDRRDRCEVKAAIFVPFEDDRHGVAVIDAVELDAVTLNRIGTAVSSEAAAFEVTV